MKWQFKNVAGNIDYRIDHVVKNCGAKHDSGEFYYKCSRLGSGRSVDVVEYINKCVELMNTQKKR